MRFSRTVGTLLLTTVIASGAALTAPAAAQFGSRSMIQSAFEPYVMQRDLQLLAETLGLEEWQRPIVDALLEDYLASFQAGVEDVRIRMQQAGANATPDNAAEILRPLADWSRERQALYGRFAELVKVQLSPQQVERWPVWERAIRRERLLPLSELSGEGVNLVGVLSDLAPPAEAHDAAAPAVEAYEIRVDNALVQRQKREEELMPVMMDAMARMDGQGAVEIQEKIMAARVGIRDAQEQSIAEIAEALGPEWGVKFRTLALQRAYPEIYTPSQVQRLFDSALALSDLTADQRTNIETLQAEFQRDWNVLNEQFLQAVKREEPQGPRRRITGGQGSGSDVEAMRRQRQERAMHYRQLLYGLLTPEQTTVLPGGAQYAAQQAEQIKPGANPGESPAQDTGGRVRPGSDAPPDKDDPSSGGSRPPSAAD